MSLKPYIFPLHLYFSPFNLFLLRNLNISHNLNFADYTHLMSPKGFPSFFPLKYLTDIDP